MCTVPAHSFCAPTRAKLIAALRSMPGVCAVFASSWLAATTRTPSCFQAASPFASGDEEERSSVMKRPRVHYCLQLYARQWLFVILVLPSRFSRRAFEIPPDRFLSVAACAACAAHSFA